MAHAAARRMDSPIRMPTVQVGILVYHFRLEPQAKLHAKRLNTICQPGDAVRQAGAVGYPVSQTGAVIVSLTKPAIIKYEQFNALLMRSFRNIEQLLLIKIEVSTLPVVEQDRTRAITPVTMCQPLLIQAVEGLAHAVQTVVRIHHNRLGCLERFARCELPRKTKRMDTHSQAGDAPRVHLGLCQKVARVNQAKANGLALCFGRFAPFERDKRIVVVRRSAADTAHALHARRELSGVDVPLARPRARKLQPLIVTIRQVETQAHRGVDGHNLAALVDQPHRARQRGMAGKQRI